MIRKIIAFWGFFCLISLFASCQKEKLEYRTGDIRVKIVPGENWLHPYPLVLGLSKKNPPQFAVWLEDTTGAYLSTVFCTYKIATESWINNKENRRKEALPYWCYRRGVVYDDGLLLPDKKDPLADGITGATPLHGKELQIHLADFLGPVVVKAEFNHSVDFNDFFPKDANKGDFDYSGGKEGSGQPAVVYAGTVYPELGTLHLTLIGRSSADGTDGVLYDDLDRLTTARSIVEDIGVTVFK